MLSVLFLSLFIFLPLFVTIQLKIAGERINQIGLVNVTVFALFVFSVLGTLPLFYHLDEYRYVSGVQNKYIVLKVMFFSSVNIVFFLIGVIYIRKILRLRPVKFSSQDLHPLNGFQKQFLAMAFLFCIVVLFLYLSKVDSIAIFVALTEGSEAAKIARSDMGNSFPGNYHWYKLVMHDLGNVLTFTCYALWLKRKNLLTFIPFLVTASYSTFVAVMATEKAPFAWLLIGLFMIYFLVRNDGFIPLKNVVPFALLLLGTLMMSYLFFMGSSDLTTAAWSVFSRAFSGSISPAYFYLEFFPAHEDYLWGKTFPNPGGLLPYEPYRYTVEVMNWRFPALLESGVVGSAPTVFWGEAYANFGPAGIPVVAFVIGCLTGIVSFFVSKIEVNAFTVGFSVWLMLTFKNLSTTGFSVYFYNIYIIFLVIVVALVLSLRGYFKIRRNV